MKCEWIDTIDRLTNIPSVNRIYVYDPDAENTDTVKLICAVTVDADPDTEQAVQEAVQRSAFPCEADLWWRGTTKHRLLEGNETEKEYALKAVLAWRIGTGYTNWFIKRLFQGD